MAVLGANGRLLLKREAPPVCLINPDAIDAENDVLLSICEGYWSGDHISSDCLQIGDIVFPPNVDKYATYYGSKFFLGPNRDQITDFGDEFYKTGSEDYPDGQFGDSAQFYARRGDTSDGEIIGGCIPDDFWIHIDELGHVSFYTSRCAALAGCEKDRLDLGKAYEQFTIAPYGPIEYQNAVWECVDAFGEYKFSDGEDTFALIDICEEPPLFWQTLCEIREWSLELSAPAVDTTSVAEKFGNAVKSLVTGGGSTEFFIDRKCFEEDQDNGRSLMKLLLMTQKGCQASAQFWMIDRPGCGVNLCTEVIKGDLYYEADILITQSAVNLRPTEMVVGTAQFVTTGEIRLNEAS